MTRRPAPRSPTPAHPDGGAGPVQRLFGNVYPLPTRTGTAAMKPARRPPEPEPVRRRGPPPAARSSVAAIGLLALLLLTPAFASGDPSVLTGFPGYNSGRMTVFFPDSAPTVALEPAAPGAAAAVLSITAVVEIAPAENADHPLVVAAATPLGGTPFDENANGSGAGTFSLGIGGSMLVRPVGVPIWTGTGVVSPNGSAAPVSGTAELYVAYALTTPSATAQGLDLSWSISGWPWRSSTDRLGLELTFRVSQATGFDACVTSPVLPGAGSGGAPCAGSALSPGGIVGNSTAVTSLAATTPTGAAAEFAWGPTAAPDGALRAGAYYAGPGTADLLLTAPPNGSAPVTGEGRIVIAAPPLPGAPATLRGVPGAYAAALAASSALGAAALLGYRRRDRRLRERL